MEAAGPRGSRSPYSSSALSPGRQSRCASGAHGVQTSKSEWGPNELDGLCKVIELDTGFFKPGQELKLRRALKRRVCRNGSSDLRSSTSESLPGGWHHPSTRMADAPQAILTALAAHPPIVEKTEDRAWRVDSMGSSLIQASACPGFDLPFDMRSAWRSTNARTAAAVLEVTDAVYHEHCYHMFLEWYCNFWALMKEIDLREAARPSDRWRRSSICFPGSIRSIAAAACSPTRPAWHTPAKTCCPAQQPPADMFLWTTRWRTWSARQFDPARYLDRRSVHAFLGSRWYATDESVSFHEHIWPRHSPFPTYFSSAYTYRKYVQYTMAQPRRC